MLETLHLGHANAVSCEACGYVGVEADHSGEPQAAETWADAFQRFEEQNKGELRDDNGNG